MSRSRDLADLGGVTTRLDQVGNSEGALSNRNMVLNGSMAVAQRATSVTGLGGNADAYNTLDRFKLSAEGSMAGRLTMSKTADGPNGISANCLKLDCTTADTSIAAGEALVLSTSLEGQDVQRLGKGVAGAKQSVISFYVKASSSLTFAVELFDSDHARHIVKLFTATTGWNRIEFNVPADVDDGSSPLNDDNGSSLSINFWLHGGSNFTGGTLATAWANKTNNNTRAAGIDSFFSSTDNNFFLTGLQFELGTATPFEHISYGDQLQKCQRYFFKLEGVHNARLGIGGYVVGATEARFDFILPVSMRAVPTLSGSGTASFDASTDSADFTITNMVINSPPAGTITGLGLQIATSGMVAGQAGGLRLRSAGSSLTLDSEL